MIFPEGIPVFGDQSYRGRCPAEATEQALCVAWFRAAYPEKGQLIIHPRNEGRRSANRAMIEKLEGLTSGASDLIVPTRIALVCELKRRDHTQSALQDNQVAYLRRAQAEGAFACIALGLSGFQAAVAAWIEKIEIDKAGAPR